MTYTVKQIVRSCLANNLTVIKKSDIKDDLWNCLQDYDDVVSYLDFEYEIILSDCDTFVEIVQTENIDSEDEVFSQDEEYEDEDEDYDFI